MQPTTTCHDGGGQKWKRVCADVYTKLLIGGGLWHAVKWTRTEEATARSRRMELRIRGPCASPWRRDLRARGRPWVGPGQRDITTQARQFTSLRLPPHRLLSCNEHKGFYSGTSCCWLPISLSIRVLYPHFAVSHSPLRSKYGQTILGTGRQSYTALVIVTAAAK